MSFISTAQQLALQQKYGYAAPQAGSGYWRPREFTDRPATPYPAPEWAQSPLAAAAPAKRRRPYRGSFAQRYNRMRGNDQFSITPGSPAASAGPGSYMGPGTHAEDQRWQQQAAMIQAQELARSRGGGLHAGGYAAGGGGGGYGGGGGGGGYGGNEFFDAYQSAMDRANQENEARYRDILEGQQARYERGMGLLEGAGNQERADINEAYDAQGAALRQGVISRGLGNSSVSDTMQMGNLRERSNSMGRLNDRLIQQRMAADAQLSGDVLNFMERREDSGPDYNQLAQLAQMLGRGGYGADGFGAAPQAPNAPVMYAPEYVSPQSLGYQIPSFGSVAMGGGGGGVAGLAGGPRTNTSLDRGVAEALRTGVMPADPRIRRRVMELRGVA